MTGGGAESVSLMRRHSAKPKLFLTRSKTRHGAPCEASRFLNEVPSQLFTFPDRAKTKQKKKKQPS